MAYVLWESAKRCAESASLTPEVGDHLAVPGLSEPGLRSAPDLRLHLVESCSRTFGLEAEFADTPHRLHEDAKPLLVFCKSSNIRLLPCLFCRSRLAGGHRPNQAANSCDEFRLPTPAAISGATRGHGETWPCWNGASGGIPMSGSRSQWGHGASEPETMLCGGQLQRSALAVMFGCGLGCSSLWAFALPPVRTCAAQKSIA